MAPGTPLSVPGLAARLEVSRSPVREAVQQLVVEGLAEYYTSRAHFGTIHAGTALGALRRLEQLIQEAVATVPRALIAETIDLVAVLAGRGSSRRS